ncbi:ferritin-like domain-containing protein [Nocardiopsis akebiae]|uniref:Ferritin-like domain-containing protein n=1 Tax=Nocardiopsis akebiae TaxID=2831968 RepID=A0ABX8C7C8_9ACTN|nr:ferritin-like domain-containing protein [Nocardiopsis akebiae]QUX30311.1 ferritin-like domain-containing protein [Nocardiopsis akebiae]
MSESPASAGEETDAGLRALAEALRAEHAAVYGYEFIGGAAEDGDRRDRAGSTAHEHKAVRDALHAAAVERGVDPPPALASYPVADEYGDEAVDAYAAGLEQTAARAHLWLTASRDTDLRVTGARALQETTVRLLEWGGALDALPGFDEAG